MWEAGIAHWWEPEKNLSRLTKAHLHLLLSHVWDPLLNTVHKCGTLGIGKLMVKLKFWSSSAAHPQPWLDSHYDGKKTEQRWAREIQEENRMKRGQRRGKVKSKYMESVNKEVGKGARGKRDNPLKNTVDTLSTRHLCQPSLGVGGQNSSCPSTEHRLNNAFISLKKWINCKTEPWI